MYNRSSVCVSSIIGGKEVAENRQSHAVVLLWTPEGHRVDIFMKQADIQQIENMTVDSRVRHTNLSIPQTHPIYQMEMLYCVFCQKPMACGVSIDCAGFISPSNVVAVCDQCEADHGKPPLEEVPQEIIKDIPPEIVKRA